MILPSQQHWFYEARRAWENQPSPLSASPERGRLYRSPEEEAQQAIYYQQQQERARIGLSRYQERIQAQNANLRREYNPTPANTWHGSFDVFLEKDFSEKLMGYANSLSDEQRKGYLSWVGMVAVEGWKVRHSQSQQNASQSFYTGQQLSEADFDEGFKKLYVRGDQVLVSGMNELRTHSPKDAEVLKADFKRDAETYKSELEFLQNQRAANAIEAQKVWDYGARSFANHILWIIPIDLHSDRNTSDEKWRQEREYELQTFINDLNAIRANDSPFTDNKIWEGLRKISNIRNEVDKKITKWKQSQQTLTNPNPGNEPHLSESANDFLNRMEAIYRSLLKEKQKQFQMNSALQLAGETVSNPISSNEEYGKATAIRNDIAETHGLHFSDTNTLAERFGMLSISYQPEVFQKLVSFVGHTINGFQIDKNGNHLTNEVVMMQQVEKYIEQLEKISTKISNNPEIAEQTKQDRELAAQKIAYFKDQLRILKKQHAGRSEVDTGVILHSELIDDKGNLNTNLALKEMAHVHTELEKVIFSNLAAPPDASTKSFLIYASEAGGVPAASLHRLLQNIAVYEADSNHNMPFTAKFYGDIGAIINEQNPQKKEFLIKKFTIDANLYWAHALNASERDNFYNALRSYREVNLDQKGEISQESMFEKQYGVKAGFIYAKYLEFFTTASQDERKILLAEQWNPSNPVIQQFLLFAVGSQRLSQIPQNQLPSFIQQIRGYIKERQNTTGATGSASPEDVLDKFGKEANAQGNLSTFFGELKDYATNGEMQGTGVMVALAVLLLMTKKGRKIAMGAGIATLVGVASSDLYENIKGSNMWDDAERYALGEEISTTDPVGMFMERAEGMDKRWGKYEIDKRDRLFAGMALKGIDPSVALQWYENVSQSTLSEKEKYKLHPFNIICENEIAKKALGFIKAPAGENSESYKAKAMYQYLENFFMHVSANNKEHPNDVASPENGFGYIRDTYLGNTAEARLLQNSGKFNMDIIFASEVTAKQEKMVKEGKSQMIADLSELWGVTSGFMARKFDEFEQNFGIDLSKEGKDMLAFVQKMGYKVWEGAGDELVFWDGTNEATKFIVEKYDNAPWIIKLPFMLTGKGLEITNDALKASPDAIMGVLNWLKTSAVDPLANYALNANATPISPNGNTQDAFKVALKDYISNQEIQSAIIQAYGIRGNMSPSQWDAFINAIVPDETAFFAEIKNIRTSIISKAQAGIIEGTFSPTADDKPVQWGNITSSEVMQVIQGGAIANAVSSVGYLRNAWNAVPAAGTEIANFLGMQAVGAGIEKGKFNSTGPLVSLQTTEYVDKMIKELPTIPNIMKKLKEKDPTTQKSPLEDRAKELSDSGIIISVAELENAFVENMKTDTSWAENEVDAKGDLKSLVPKIGKEKAKEMALNLLATLQEKKNEMIIIQTNLNKLYATIKERKPTPKATDAEKNAASAQLLNADEIGRRFNETLENTKKVFAIWREATSEQSASLSTLQTEFNDIYVDVKDFKAFIDSIGITPPPSSP